MASALKRLRRVGRTAAEIERLLSAKYAAPQYAFLAQVRSCTGASSARTADALALGLWPSRGIHLHGFEIKVHRSDWIKELRQPEKAEEICQFCDRWWVVVDHESIVEDGELPATWGLMVADGSSLSVKAEAPLIPAKPLTKDMLAGILRKASEAMVTTADVKPMVDQARKEGEERAKSDANYEAKQLRLAVDAFEEASGVKIAERWDSGDIGKAVRLIRDIGLVRAVDTAQTLRDYAQRIVEQSNQCLAEF